ncbi:hypothetical protein GIB67_017690 [Kingdonia uniflora]|uniref:DUF4283 domain-containing protein n=1 Tax=Kingdonia uniflora TaxID=39325 RepID=A0A7J7NAC2_9MAGN|nr:hypothetical protein GIB67_017690 [Kingdonia uniflora]
MEVLSGLKPLRNYDKKSKKSPTVEKVNNIPEIRATTSDVMIGSFQSDMEKIQSMASALLEASGKSSNPNSVNTHNMVKEITYADKLRGNTMNIVSLDQIPNPTISGDKTVVSILKNALDEEIEYFKFSLIGKLPFLSITLEAIRQQAIAKGKLKGSCKFIAIGRGFFVIRLDKVCWVRFPKLQLEYWNVHSLMSMGKAVGVPIRIGRATRNKRFGFFASVLVEVDFSKTIPSTVTLIDENVEIIQEVPILDPSRYCSHCKIIGHVFFDCRAIKTAIEEGDKAKTNQEKNKQEKKNKKRGEPKRKEKSCSSSNPIALPNTKAVDRSAQLMIPKKEQLIEELTPTDDPERVYSEVRESDQYEQVQA